MGCLCIHVANPSRLLSEKIIIAQKEHCCCECGSQITKGEKFEKVAGIDPSKGFFCVKTCLPCRTIRREFFPCGWWYKDLRRMFISCMEFDYLGNRGYELARIKNLEEQCPGLFKNGEWIKLYSGNEYIGD